MILPISDGMRKLRYAMSVQTIASKKVLTWVVGALLGLVGSLVGYSATEFEQRVDAIEQNADKVPVIEGDIRHMRESVERIERMVEYFLQQNGHYRQDFQEGRPTFERQR